MTALVDCLFSALLIILPPPERATYEAPAFRGLCLSRQIPSLFINDLHQLIIVYKRQRYEIPLPPHEGSFHLRYLLGSDQADIDHWGHIQVRFGPEGEF